MRRIEFAGRLLGTGIAFACIFFGGGVLAVTLLPVLAILPGHRQERARRAIHHAFRLYIAILRLLNLIKLRTTGLHKLDRATGRVIVANHPSLLDVVLLALSGARLLAGMTIELVPPREGRSPWLADAALAEAVRNGWLTPPQLREPGPPPRIPVAPTEELLAELSRDRGDR